MPIYVDFDYTLAYAIYKDAARREASRFVFRPGAGRFLEALSAYGDVRILTASVGDWARDALKERPELSRHVSGIIDGEALAKVDAQIEMVVGIPGLSREEKRSMLGTIKPIAEPGAIFDDVGPGDELYYLKTIAVGVFRHAPDFWIQVPEFSKENPDAGGLEEAFHEFRKRNALWQRAGMGGPTIAMELESAQGYNPI
jgi:hypothetical protein